MPIINKGTAFSNGEQLTADKINNLLDLATFNQSATDSASTTVNSASQIVVADSGVTTAKLATDAVETAKIAANAVTTTKILDANVTFAKLTDVIDDDTMATATATTLATSESIKAYVDSTVDSAPSIKAWCVFRPYSTGTNAPLAGSGVTSVKRVSSGVYEVNLSTAAPSSTYACFASGDSDDINQSSISIGAWSETTTKAKILVTNNVGNQVGTTENVSFSAIW